MSIAWNFFTVSEEDPCYAIYRIFFTKVFEFKTSKRNFRG